MNSAWLGIPAVLVAVAVLLGGAAMGGLGASAPAQTLAAWLLSDLWVLTLLIWLVLSRPASLSRR